MRAPITLQRAFALVGLAPAAAPVRELAAAVDTLSRQCAEVGIAEPGVFAARVRFALPRITAQTEEPLRSATTIACAAFESALADPAVAAPLRDALAHTQLALLRGTARQPLRAAKRLRPLRHDLVALAVACRGVPLRPPLARRLRALQLTLDAALAARLFPRRAVRSALADLMEELRFPTTLQLARPLRVDVASDDDEQRQFAGIESALAVRRLIEQVDDPVVGRFLAGTWCRIIFALTRRADYAFWLPLTVDTATKVVALSSSGADALAIEAVAAQLRGAAILCGQGRHDVEAFVAHLRRAAGSPRLSARTTVA